MSQPTDNANHEDDGGLHPRSWESWRFYESGGIISTLRPSSIESHLRALSQAGRTAENWEVERFMNHQHPNTSRVVTRDDLRGALDMAAGMGTAPRHAWPD